MVPLTTESTAATIPQDDRWLTAQTTQLYAQASLGASATIINSTILVAVLRNHTDRVALSLWWLTLLLITAVRFAHAHRFNVHISKAAFDGRWWSQAFIAGIGVSGFVWGLSGVILFPESIPHQSFIAFVLGGMVAGAAATFSVRMDAFLAFSVPALAPLIIQLFRQGSEYHAAMGAMILLFGLLLTGTAYRVHTLVNQSLRDELDKASPLEATARTDETSPEATAEPMRETRDLRAERLTTFARGVSERVAEHNATILENVHVALRNPDLFESGLSRDLLHRIDRSSGELMSLVDQLVEYGDERVGHFRTVDLSNEVSRALDDWEAKSDSGVELRRHLVKMHPRVVADPRQIRTLVRHVLTNAEEATPSTGSIVVTTGLGSQPSESEDPFLSEVAEMERFVFVKVEDTGAGMPKDSVQRLFDPFFSTKEAGRGMGMASVLAIARRHGARVAVVSAAGQGTSVRFDFPVSRRARS